MKKLLFIGIFFFNSFAIAKEKTNHYLDKFIQKTCYERIGDEILFREESFRFLKEEGALSTEAVFIESFSPGRASLYIWLFQDQNREIVIKVIPKGLWQAQTLSNRTKDRLQSVLEHCSKNGVQTPIFCFPNACFSFKEYDFILLNKANGKKLRNIEKNEQVYRNLGEQIGSFHTLLSSFQICLKITDSHGGNVFYEESNNIFSFIDLDASSSVIRTNPFRSMLGSGFEGGLPKKSFTDLSKKIEIFENNKNPEHLLFLQRTAQDIHKSVLEFISFCEGYKSTFQNINFNTELKSMEKTKVMLLNRIQKVFPEEKIMLSLKDLQRIESLKK